MFASATGNTPATIAYADAHFVTAPLLLDLGGRQLPPQLRHVVLATPRMKKMEQVRRLLNLDDGTGALNEWVGWQDGEVHFCSKNLASIGIELRDPEGSLLDMAEAMLAHGVVQPKPRQRDEL